MSLDFSNVTPDTHAGTTKAPWIYFFAAELQQQPDSETDQHWSIIGFNMIFVGSELLRVCACVCMRLEVRRDSSTEEQMCAVLWWCVWTDGDQVQPLSPQHLSPLACIQLPCASPPQPPLSWGGVWVRVGVWGCGCVGGGGLPLALGQEAPAVPSLHPFLLSHRWLLEVPAGQLLPD